MLKLPVNHSVISSDALVLAITDLYDLGDVMECRFFSNGLNDTYKIKTASEKYILRIYKSHWRNRQDVLFEVQLLNHLNERDIPVSAPVNRKNGDFVIDIDAPEGPRFAVLFTYVEGGYSDEKEKCALYGEHVAKMHLAMNGFQSVHARFRIDLVHLLEQPLQPIRAALSHRPEDIAYLESLSTVLSNRINELSSSLDWGVCHGDLHGANVHFHENSLMHFDFDCGGFGWRAYDVSVFLWAKVRGRGKEHFHNEQWDVFLESYQKRKALSEFDLTAIPLFVAIREIWLMGLHTGNSHVWGGWQDDHYFNTNLQFLKDWCEQHSIK
jgi:Ser/Thr protein kinase RdoA (MazF antagonist)